ncbi:hypothetical protein MMC25_003413 [Agyrium rufum]|nr:hypothetical protein [Agyrium rufum]
MATTHSVYGPQNPYADPTVERSFWDFADGLTLLLVNFIPSITARKGYSGRRKVAEAFVTYYKNNGHEQGSKLALNRYNIKVTGPVLTSTYQEVLRHRAAGTSVRQVMEDITLDGTYLLKKGAMVQMPCSVIHTDRDLWGADVNEFNHRRFMKNPESTIVTGNHKRPKAAAFRAFGGGHTLCPGRHFATTEIMALVVMFVMRYDLIPAGGEWIAPSCEKTGIALGIMEPDTDIPVLVKSRSEYDEGSWAFTLADSEMVFAVVEEDVN